MIGLGVVLTLAVVGGVAGCWILKAWDGMVLDRATYDQVSVGQSKTDADRLLPHGGSKILAKFKQQGPPKPRGATCRHFLAKDERPVVRGGVVVYRVCFATGSVVAKNRYEADRDRATRAALITPR